jgi:hypothetical protein
LSDYNIDVSKHILAIASSVRVLLERTGPVMAPELLVAATQILWRLLARSREIQGDFRKLLDDVGPFVCDTLSFLLDLMQPYQLRPMDGWTQIVGSIEGRLSEMVLNVAKKFSESFGAYAEPAPEPRARSVTSVGSSETVVTTWTMPRETLMAGFKFPADYTYQGKWPVPELEMIPPPDVIPPGWRTQGVPRTTDASDSRDMRECTSSDRSYLDAIDLEVRLEDAVIVALRLTR